MKALHFTNSHIHILSYNVEVCFLSHNNSHCDKSRHHKKTEFKDVSRQEFYNGKKFLIIREPLDFRLWKEWVQQRDGELEVAAD